MKKNKILTLVALGTLSVGVVAGGVALSSNDKLADAETSEKCVLTFDKDSIDDYSIVGDDGMPTESSIQESYTQIYTENLTPCVDNLVSLEAGQSIYNKNIDYTTSQGWGSALHGLKKLKINATGNYEVLVGYNYSTPLYSLGNFTKPSVINDAQLANLYEEPAYFKITAKEATVVASILIEANESIPTIGENYPAGKYVGEVTINNTKTFQDMEINVISEEQIQFFNYNEAGNELVSQTIYAGGYTTSITNIDNPTSLIMGHGQAFYSNPNAINKKSSGQFFVHYNSTNKTLQIAGAYWNDQSKEICNISFEGKIPVVATSLGIKKGSTIVTGTTIEMTEEDVITLKPDIKPVGTTEKVTWSANNQNVTLKDDVLGAIKVTAVKAGTAEVTVKVGKLEAKVTINITAKPAGVAFPSDLVGFWSVTDSSDTQFSFADDGTLNIMSDSDELLGTGFQYTQTDLAVTSITGSPDAYTIIYKDPSINLNAEFYYGASSLFVVYNDEFMACESL